MASREGSLISPLRPQARYAIDADDVDARDKNATTTQAASQNHAKARCNLGIMFASGIGAVSYTHLTLPTKRIV